jgi:hypothetical protein
LKLVSFLNHCRRDHLVSNPLILHFLYETIREGTSSITGSATVKPLRKEDPSCLFLGEDNSHLGYSKTASCLLYPTSVSSSNAYGLRNT